MRRMPPNCRWRCRIMAIPTAMSRSAISGYGGSARLDRLQAQLGQRGVEMRQRFRRRAGIRPERWACCPYSRYRQCLPAGNRSPPASSRAGGRRTAPAAHSRAAIFFLNAIGRRSRAAAHRWPARNRMPKRCWHSASSQARPDRIRSAVASADRIRRADPFIDKGIEMQRRRRTANARRPAASGRRRCARLSRCCGSRVSGQGTVGCCQIGILAIAVRRDRRQRQVFPVARPARPSAAAAIAAALTAQGSSQRRPRSSPR